MSCCVGNLVAQSAKARTIDKTETESLTSIWKIAWLCKYWLKEKRMEYVVHPLFPQCVTKPVSEFPLTAATSWGCSEGSQTSFKNRTRYYGGISKWPIKNKGVPRSSSLELTPWPAFHWQLLFNVVGGESVPDLRRNTSSPYSPRKGWKDAWKSGAHFGSQTGTSVQYVGLHLSDVKQTLELWQIAKVCAILRQFLKASAIYCLVCCQRQSWETGKSIEISSLKSYRLQFLWIKST